MNGRELLEKLRVMDLQPLTHLKREAVFLTLSLISTVVFYRFVYIPGVRELGAVESQMKSTRIEMDKIKNEIQAAEDMRKSVADAARSLKAADEKLKYLQERLPTGKSISTILREISGGAERTELRIVTIKPLPSEEKGALIRLPFQITLQSRFISFGEYLERIEGLERVMIVDNFMIEAKDDSAPAVTSQVYLSAYIMGRSQ
ncbi:MAG: type 4a pilus biogenesis protein PilO [Deltaproteobacteria bacterium]|nr:type 4a pilus biogenesis protein PilO [Deltaproteobacteria bacterium]